MSGLLLLHGDACHVPLANQSIHCVITSPPYYGLRSYAGIEPSVWPGGTYAPVAGVPPIVIPGSSPDEMMACAHVWGEEIPQDARHRYTPENSGAKHTAIHNGAAVTSRGTICLRCGCWRGTHGNEDTPHRYLWHCLLWLREMKRVLRDDGVAWIVIGDSYSQEGKWGGASGHKNATSAAGGYGREKPVHGISQGALLGIPGRLHQAALADGWIVRNDVVWSKTSPMPESIRGWAWQQTRCGCVGAGREAARKALQAQTGVTRETAYAYLPHGATIGDHARPDPACPRCGGTGRLAEEVLRQGSWRHTRSHETVLMLCKQMGYFSDSEAVREASTAVSHGNSSQRYSPAVEGQTLGRATLPHNGLARRQRDATTGRNPRSVLRDAPSATGELASLLLWLLQHAPEALEAYQADQREPDSVVTPHSSSPTLAHYARFPASLLEPLLKATCPERVCPQCGQGWAPVITHTSHQKRPSWSGNGRKNGCIAGGGHEGRTGQWSTETTIHGLRPTCPHYCVCATAPCTCSQLPRTAYLPGLVLDPFVGSGTTLEVARALGRRSVGVDCSLHYLKEIACERLGLAALAAWEGKNWHVKTETFSDLPLFLEVTP